MKGNWFKWVLASTFLVGSMAFLAKSIAQTSEPPESVVIISREDMEKIKTEFLAMRFQVELMRGQLKTCNSLLYPGL